MTLKSRFAAVEAAILATVLSLAFAIVPLTGDPMPTAAAIQTLA